MINFKSLYIYQTLIWFVAALFICSLAGGAVYYFYSSFQKESLAVETFPKALHLKQQLEKHITVSDELTMEKINTLFLQAQSLGINNITVFDLNGMPLVNMEKNEILPKLNADNTERKMMLYAKENIRKKKYIKYVSDLQKGKMNYYVYFTYSNNKIGMASYSIVINNGKKIVSNAIKAGGICAAVLFIILAGYYMFINVTLLTPIRKIKKTVEKIAQGNVDVRIPVVRNDELGIIASSVNEISVVLQHLRDESITINPLTELPGALAIEKYVDDALQENRIICVLFIDIDNFNAYNSKYGFMKGDDVIKFIRDCLQTTASGLNVSNIFIGHQGGDDFIAVVDFEYWENFVKSLLTVFDKGINRFYSSIDFRNGFVEILNRKGEKKQIPVMSLSTAIISNKNRPFTRFAEITQVATEVQRYVKGMSGSSYAFDRRTGPVGTR
jgi:GGDEF domain-containing protein